MAFNERFACDFRVIAKTYAKKQKDCVQTNKLSSYIALQTRQTSHKSAFVLHMMKNYFKDMRNHCTQKTRQKVCAFRAKSLTTNGTVNNYMKRCSRNTNGKNNENIPHSSANEAKCTTSRHLTAIHFLLCNFWCETISLPFFNTRRLLCERFTASHAIPLMFRIVACVLHTFQLPHIVHYIKSKLLMLCSLHPCERLLATIANECSLWAAIFRCVSSRHKIARNQLKSNDLQPWLTYKYLTPPKLRLIAALSRLLSSTLYLEECAAA